MFTIFTRQRGISDAINKPIHKAILLCFFGTPKGNVKEINLRSAKNPKLIRYHSCVPWATAKLILFFCNLHNTLTTAKNLININAVLSWIFMGIC